ncbi:MAG TPA: hypothetical protein VFH88_08040 [Candidatus Krumholzibacteria bacterium]|nr:hypothetical protein [Candidatus Krumholzibacteria bacterium]
MSSAKCSLPSARLAAFVSLAVAGAALLVFSCSSDPTGTLGSDSDLLGSKPGTVYQDTIGVYADTTYAFDTPISTDTDLEVGRQDGYIRTMVLQPGFILSDGRDVTESGDVKRTVLSASFHFYTANISQSFPVRFYGTGHYYSQGDNISDLDTLMDADAILDPVAGSIERHLETAEPLYPLPPALVQDWIRDTTKREAVAIVYTDSLNERVATIPASETSDHPYLQVIYTDGVQRAYNIRYDATSYRPVAPATHLVVSDGYARRVYMRFTLDELDKDSAVHTARVRFHIVPGSVIEGVNPTLLLYIPDSTDPAKSDFKNGQRVTEQGITISDETVEFPLTNAIFLVLQGKLKDNGFAIRFKNETTELRQVELYGTSAPDSLRPQVFVTSSTPAVFH